LSSVANSKPELLLASRRCTECLASKQRIVSGARAAQIIKACRDEDNHFICHKGSAAGKVVHCAGVHQYVQGRAYKFAQAFGIPIVRVDPENL
jgi:hypothetical protein